MRSDKGAGRLDVNALENWLAARPPETLLASADRLLIASVDPARPDRMTVRGGIREEMTERDAGESWTHRVKCNSLSRPGTYRQRATTPLAWPRWLRP